MAGHHEEARAQAERYVKLSSRSPYALKNLAVVLARMGDGETPRALLEELETRAQHGYVPAAALSWLYSIAGETEPAIHWLTRAFEERSNAMVYVDIEFAFDSIRNDPRFRALRARVGLP
jgi:Flp pilus assembly protein TadD